MDLALEPHALLLELVALRPDLLQAALAGLELLGGGLLGGEAGGRSEQRGGEQQRGQAQGSPERGCPLRTRRQSFGGTPVPVSPARRRVQARPSGGASQRARQ
ncbi:MAG: hypothetical protein ACM34D_12040 [Gemmatimonadota bacterium]